MNQEAARHKTPDTSPAWRPRFCARTAPSPRRVTQFCVRLRIRFPLAVLVLYNPSCTSSTLRPVQPSCAGTARPLKTRKPRTAKTIANTLLIFHHSRSRPSRGHEAAAARRTRRTFVSAASTTWSRHSSMSTICSHVCIALN